MYVGEIAPILLEIQKNVQNVAFFCDITELRSFHLANLVVVTINRTKHVVLKKK